MPKYSEITLEQVRALIAQYDVGEVVNFEYVNGGLANTNLKVFVANGAQTKPFLLKVCEEKSLEELNFQLAALHQLKAHKFPGAFPYPKKSGPADFVATLWNDTKQLKSLLFDFLPGKPGGKATMNRNKANELGRALAKLHSIPAPDVFLQTRPRFPPGLADIDPFLSNDLSGLSQHLQQHEFVTKYLGEILLKCRPFLELPELPRGIVHGDIFPDNCMFDGDALIAVLDFEEAALEPLVLDTAVTIVGCFYDESNKLNFDWTLEFLNSYISERSRLGRSVEELEHRLLPHFVNYALIAIAFWRWRQFNIRRPELSHLKDHYREISSRIDEANFETFYAKFFADKFWHYKNPQGAKYTSTRCGVHGMSFESVLLSGYAKDGGLVMAEEIPYLPMETILRWRGCSYTEIVKSIMSIYVPEAEIPFQDLSSIIDDAFSTFDHKAILPLSPVGDLHILEMFHGQTGAFKDLAMSIIGRLIEYFLKKSGRYATIVVGTSGDTGSAAIYAVRGRQRVDIIVLYPHGRISEIQQLQMVTSPDSNVHVFACDGTSDDLDEPIKVVLNDSSFVSDHSLCSINSINWARVMIQIAHFFYSYLSTVPAQLQSVEEVAGFNFYASVPTGACGNLVGAWLAREMGLPIKIIAGVNENDIIHRAMTTGAFSKASTVEKTIAPSMDIQVPYNWERILYFVSNKDGKAVAEVMEQFYKTGSAVMPTEWMNKLRAVLSTASVNQSEMRRSIKQAYEAHKYVMEPHTAIGVEAYRKVVASDGSPHRAVVCLATATPAKFIETMQDVLGFKPALPEAYTRLYSATQHSTPMNRGDNWEHLLRKEIQAITDRRRASEAPK